MSTIFHTISGCACGGVGKMTAVLEPKIRGHHLEHTILGHNADIRGQELSICVTK